MSDDQTRIVLDRIVNWPYEELADEWYLINEIKRLRAELASFKENGCDGCELPLWWAEAIKLRAELAAAGNQMVEYGDRRVSDETERCAKIAETFDPSSWYFGPQIAAAIRASNAAPVDVQKSDPNEDTHQWAARMHRQSEASNATPPQPEDKLDHRDFGIPDDVMAEARAEFAEEKRQAVASPAAPPHVEPGDSLRFLGKIADGDDSELQAMLNAHVEPSAAESEREPCAFCGGAAGSGISWNGFGLSGNEKSIKEVQRLMFVESYVDALRRELLQRREEATAQLAAEARMVELARWVRENPTRSDCVMELAALVIEKFGGGK